MQLINRIFTQHSTQASTPANQTSFQSNNIYTLEDLVQTLEEAANYLAAFS
ncbi:serine dehydratase [Anabaena cylindrica FACHB-243]|nr:MULTISPECIES: serine dehydratase [Anabaena]MBD2420009.1 serine dehydratase [Anabaena cylindrica FACHB-243]MBY5283020.1 serine dehydratase [Anabaena sp. CCAP 1446/1C]MBY5306481.1 serine dehydratase [Anabaena sp. CCAP 1446/1C]MCM2407096.1 serine dehydratase [Anabaena sp. CCAP 1446/1C]